MKVNKVLGIVVCLCIFLLAVAINLEIKNAKKPKEIEVEKIVEIEVEKTVEIEKIVEVEKIIEVEKIVYVENDIDLMDWYWLARIVFAETEGDIDLGQQAVANVVLNRIMSNNFPDTIYDVVWQKTGKVWQFSPCGDGRINLEPSDRAIKNAKLVLEGLRVVPDDVMFFYMPTEGNRDNWIRSRKVFKKIGVHRFCY